MAAASEAAAVASSSPEAVLDELVRANAHGNASGGGGGACARRWRLGGCRHCPTPAQVAELWRAAAERRRAGGFVPLVPSEDPEWSALSRPPMSDAARARAGGESRGGAGLAGGGEAASAAPLSTHALLAAWLRVRPPAGARARGAGAAASVRARWEAITCDS